MAAKSAYTLSVKTAALMERVESLATETKPASKMAAKLVEEAAAKLTLATDILRQEVERRRAIKERAQREINKGSTL